MALSGMLHPGFVRGFCDALVELMCDCGADAVVDFWNPYACIAARSLGKPLATVIQADIHPASQGFIWWRERPPGVPNPLPVVNGVLADYGLAPVEKVEELCAGDLTLMLGTPETDPLPEPSGPGMLGLEVPGVNYVGPVLWQSPGAELPGWMGFLDRERPVIWLYSGNPRYLPLRSPVDSAVVLQASIAALAEEGWTDQGPGDLPLSQVVVTTGHHALPRRFLPLPANFRHEAFLPGLAMAGESDLLIHHGGYGSCQTGLYTGTPQVIIPTYSERESNARRVAALGAGEFVLPTEGIRARKHVEAEELRAVVRQVLAEPSYAENARRASEKLREYGGAAEAARLIEDWIVG
jgi:hypothetical protein